MGVLFERRVGPPLGLRRTARREISLRLGTDVADLVVDRADGGHPAIAAGIPPAGRGARHLLRIGAYAVALHRALVEQGLSVDASMALVSDVVFAAIRPDRGAVVAIARLRHRDRLRRAMWVSRVAKRFYYTEPDWVMHDVPVEGGFGMDVSRCVVAEFFASLGMAEFCQRVICNQDARDAAYRGIDFERAGTLAGGAARCDFRYHVDHQEAAV